jgi:hypothetical protein
MRHALLLSLLLCGCFHIRLNEKTADSQFHQTLVTTPFTDSVVDQPCKELGTGLQTVRYTSNLGYAWLSVLTLGIVNVVNVEYSCAPQNGVEHVPLPTPDG